MKKFCLFCLVLPFFYSCVPTNVSYPDGADWIPENFNPQKDILLVETYVFRHRNHSMIKFLTKYYKGKFEVVDRSEILSTGGKYADIEKYPFGILWEKDLISKKNGTILEVDGYGHFYDRINQKEYPTTKKDTYYASSIYIPFMNAIINHFKNK